MPAILCPGCHKLISSDEPRCPYCGQLRPGMWGMTSWVRRIGLQADFPQVITVAFVGLYLLGLLLDPSAIFQSGNPLSLLSPSLESSFHTGATGAVPVFQYGRWWTIITAIYLHGGLLHIFFNTMWVRQLGPVVGQIYGPFRLFSIFTIAGAMGFVFSVLRGSPFTLGASGSIFGLLAAVIVYGRQTGQTMVSRKFLQWAVLLFIMGLLPGFNIDNWAHGGGFVGGYLVSYLFSPGRGSREGVGTYALTVACVLVTIGAFARQFLAYLTS